MLNLCVIVLNYYSHQSTEECIDSLVGQKLDTLYLVDNSVDQQQAHYIEALAEKLLKQRVKFKVVVLVSKENLGFGAGINSAIKDDYKQTGGHKSYLLLNNDTILPVNTIQVLLKAKHQKPEAVLITPKIDWGGREIRYNGYLALLGHVTSYPTRFSEPYVTGCCLLVDSVLIDDNHNLFDEDFFMYGEDIHLNWKAKQIGKEIFCTDQVTIFHEGTGSSSHGGLFYEYHVARGHVLLGIKSGNPIIKVIPYVVGRIAYLFLRGIIRSVRYRSLIPMQAFLMSWFPIKVRVT